MGIADLRIAEFLDALGSKTPTPGGGAVAGLTGAMACGLGEMVLAYSRVKRLEPHHAEIERARTELAAFRRGMVEAADDDATAYARLNAAMRTTERSEAEVREFRDAAVAATEAPVRVLRLAHKALSVLDGCAERWNHRLASDMAMAALLAAAAARSAWWNAKMNEPTLAESGADMAVVAFVAADLEQCEEIARRVQARAHAVAGV